MKRSHAAWRNPAALLAVLVMAAPQPAMAQDSGDEDAPAITGVQAGFGARIRDRFWTSLRVSVKNPGPARTGALEVISEGKRSNQRLTVRREVSLLPSSVRYVNVPAYTDVGLSGTSTNLFRFEVRLSDGKLLTWTTMEAFASLKSEARGAFMCSGDRSRSYRFLDGIKIANGGVKMDRYVIGPKRLPYRPMYYSGIDVMILGDTGKHGLTALQQSALDHWLKSGGLLILSGSDPTSWVDDPAIREWLPVTYVSSEVVEHIPLLDDFGAPFHATNGVHRHRMIPTSGEVLLGDPEDPIAVERDVGRGHVVALSFDMAARDFQSWESAPEFVFALLTTFRPTSRYATRVMADGETVETLLGGLVGKEVPTRRTVFAYLIGVIVLLLLPVFATAKRSRPEFGWLAAVVIAAGVGAAAIAVADRQQSELEDVLAEAYLADGMSGSAVRNVQAALGVYSRTEGNLPLTQPDDASWWRVSPSPVRPPDALTIRLDEGRVTASLPVRANDMRYLFNEGVAETAPLPGFRARYGPDGLEVRVDPAGDALLEDAFARIQRLVVPLGDIRPAAAGVQQVARPETANRTAAYTTRAVMGASDDARRRFRSLFMPSLEQFQGAMIRSPLSKMMEAYSHHAPALYYWSAEPGMPTVAGEEGLARRSVGLVRVTATETFAGDRLLFPQGCLPRAVVKSGPAVRVSGDGPITGISDSTLIVHWYLPRLAPTLEVDGLRLFCALSEVPFDYDVFLVPAALAQRLPAELDDALPVDGFEKLGAATTWRAEKPGRFYQDEARRVSAVLRIARRATAGQQVGKLGPRMQGWTLDNFDLELEGVPR